MADSDPEPTDPKAYDTAGTANADIVGDTPEGSYGYDNLPSPVPQHGEHEAAKKPSADFSNLSQSEGSDSDVSDDLLRFMQQDISDHEGNLDDRVRSSSEDDITQV